MRSKLCPPETLIDLYHETISDISARAAENPSLISPKRAQKFAAIRDGYTAQFTQDGVTPVYSSQKDKVVVFNEQLHFHTPQTVKYLMAHEMAKDLRNRSVSTNIAKRALVVTTMFGGMLNIVLSDNTAEAFFISSFAAIMAMGFLSDLERNKLLSIDKEALAIYPQVNLDEVESIWSNIEKHEKKEFSFRNMADTIIPAMFYDEHQVSERMKHLRKEQSHLQTLNPSV